MMAVAIGFNGFLKSDCTKVIAINARASAANAPFSIQSSLNWFNWS